jgi:AmmeMemoRadiSam system protein B
MACRRDSHAGSWYEKKDDVLGGQLSSWLEAAGEAHRNARAIISPHAGYSYSGPTAAFAYKYLHAARARVKKIFILGPSHHEHVQCELTGCTTYNTPFYPLVVDKAVVAALQATELFGQMRLSVDEAEHSIEMQLPYIAHIMTGLEFTVVPILVGSLSFEQEAKFGAVLAPYLQDASNFFVISSDFCHWGKRFSYTHYTKADGAIYQSIEKLDRAGMSLIEAQDTGRFAEYLQQYRNTICGRHPIGVLLQALQCGPGTFETSFVRYAQSSRCISTNDSSVSYAAAVVSPSVSRAKPTEAGVTEAGVTKSGV